MIGVALHGDDRQVAQEFFELFKTPWEIARPERRYSAVLSDGQPVDQLDAESFIVYGSRPHPLDTRGSHAFEQVAGPSEIAWGESAFPIYGGLALFEAPGGILRQGLKAPDCRYTGGNGGIHRVGYDLFDEVRHLLTVGQPASRAATPTLDCHIALLRFLLQDLGVAFLEIPPRPAGYDFVCCLTHDIDFFGIRRHTFDRTLVGFAVRASFGSLVDWARGRRPATEAIRNWAALMSLPLVFLRLARDFWRPFDDYALVEQGRRSTFFLVPFRARPGVGPDGIERPSRAVAYQASDIRDEARDAAGRGSELAVHGIDAWRDSNAGLAELGELTSITGRNTAGIRMHWLYYDSATPERLEQAGFDYDSTWGYNDAVGYRAGTSQVFRLLATRELLELPLTIMDSALFYPGRMGLSRPEARRLCEAIVANARRFGGTVVINWHDRSLAPERQWGQPYQELLNDVATGDRAWFATAAEAVDWFRWRRSVRFIVDATGTVSVAAPARTKGMPGARISVHPPSMSGPVVDERTFDIEAAVGLLPV
jgi:hypothetical protein